MFPSAVLAAEAHGLPPRWQVFGNPQRNRALYAHLRTRAEREGVALAERKANCKTPAACHCEPTKAHTIYAAGGGPLRHNDHRYGVEVKGRWDWSVQPA